jgi:ATP-dependent RNA helicase RhlE
MSFSTLGLSEELLQAIQNQNYKEPFPIQKEAIPAVLNNKDILGIAKTGAGKTASYVLPILTQQQDAAKKQNRHINVLVLVPTRELATQVVDVFKLFGNGLATPVKAKAVFGGVAINPQMKSLMGTQILVATPGRLIELMESNAVHISDVDTLVLDEADKMLNMGFKDQMDQILKHLPKKRQNLLFSATLSEDIKKIEKLLLNKPVTISIDQEKDPIDLIQQFAYFVSDEKKGPLLRHLIKSKNMQQVLVFTSSVQKATQVANKLRNNGIEAQAIHSKKSQGARTDLLTKFKHKHLRVLVATDLLARGIDIEFLPYVINYELPRSPKDFIHRVGRTGRAESPGEAISLITPAETHHFKIILKKLKQWVDKIDGNEIVDNISK